MQTYGQVNVNGSVQIGVNDEADLILVTTGGAFDGEVVMPSAAAVLGRRYTILRISGQTPIYVYAAPGSGDTINGSTDEFIVGSGVSYRVTFQAIQTGTSTYGYQSIY
ncbi:MAG: hypothetical protein ACJ8GN_07145 [Longimicrobiaceae bacterium]